MHKTLQTCFTVYRHSQFRKGDVAISVRMTLIGKIELAPIPVLSSDNN